MLKLKKLAHCQTMEIGFIYFIFFTIIIIFFGHVLICYNIVFLTSVYCYYLCIVTI